MFRTTLTIIAFVFSIGAAFAFAQPQREANSILVRGQDGQCPIGFVSDQCRTYHYAGAVCTFRVIFTTYMAVENDEEICELGLVLRYPDH